MNRKDVVIVVLCTLCLTVTLFSIIPVLSLPEYSVWKDINDDGVIDAKDYVLVKTAIPSMGTPINKTSLLDLQSQIDTLNVSLRSLIDTMNASLTLQIDGLNALLTTRINCLNASLAALQSRIGILENTVDNLNFTVWLLNTTGLPKPDYDSTWTNITAGQSKIFTHNQNTTNVLVYMFGKYSDSVAPYIHQFDYGGEKNLGASYGAWWSELTETTVRVTRMPNDGNWNYVRVVIWRIPE